MMRNHSNMMWILVSVSLCLPIFVGCAGTRTQITADMARYPISLSAGVRDKEGRLLSGPDLEKVGEFKTSMTSWGMGYSYGAFKKKHDISDDINEQIEAVKGEAIIKVNANVKGNCSYLNGVVLLNALPFWPGCADIEVVGEIVRRAAALTSQPSLPENQ